MKNISLHRVFFKRISVFFIIFLCLFEASLYAQKQAQDTSKLDEVTVFGARTAPPDKLQSITRMPLNPQEQLQSISVVSSKLLSEQGNLTLTEATYNIPGVYTFATFGNAGESMGARGFGAIPTLKNGIPLNLSGTGLVMDMQGVDNIQVIKGSAAITQGFATGRGNGMVGGLINLVTKTPKMGEKFGGEVSLRSGLWVPNASHGKGNTFQTIRPVFDIWGSLNERKTLAFRLNGAYEYQQGFRVGTDLQKVYINPSLMWQASKKTTIILEGDYLFDTRTPDIGTINLSSDAKSGGDIYDLNFDKNIGFDNVRKQTQVYSWTARLEQQLAPHLALRVAYFGAGYQVGGFSPSRTSFQDFFVRGTVNAQRAMALAANSGSQGSGGGRGGGRNGFPFGPFGLMRSISKAQEKELDHMLQIDLVGKNFKTGSFTHTFQVGVDYRYQSYSTSTFNPVNIDVVGDIRQAPAHSFISENDFNKSTLASSNVSTDHALGVMAQYKVSFKKYVDVFASARYNYLLSAGVATRAGGNASTRTHSQDGGINPMVGVMISPIKQLHLFGSFAYTLTPKTTSQVDINGKVLDAPVSNQFEAGIKSEWFNNRFRANITFFNIIRNKVNVQAMQPINGQLVALPYYIQSGSERSRGIEVELSGNVLTQLELVAGYAFTDARFLQHSIYENNSLFFNTPRNTFNFWAHYSFFDHARSGKFTLGVGVYYMGVRAYNVKLKPGASFMGGGVLPGIDPWNLPAYTLLNFQVSYFYRNYGARFFLHNALDQVGYLAYRNLFINRIDPRSISLQVMYRF